MSAPRDALQYPDSTADDTNRPSNNVPNSSDHQSSEQVAHEECTQVQRCAPVSVHIPTPLCRCDTPHHDEFYVAVKVPRSPSTAKGSPAHGFMSDDTLARSSALAIAASTSGVGNWSGIPDVPSQGSWLPLTPVTSSSNPTGLCGISDSSSFESFWSGSTLLPSGGSFSGSTCVLESKDLPESVESLNTRNPRFVLMNVEPNTTQSGREISSTSDTAAPFHPKLHQATRRGSSELYQRLLLEALNAPWSAYTLRSDRPSSLDPLESPGLSPCVIVPNVPNISRDKFQYLLERLDPIAHPARVNNFFNGLDLIVGDLAIRFPSDVVVNGLCRALERLESFYRFNHGQGSANMNQHTSGTDREPQGDPNTVQKSNSPGQDQNHQSNTDQPNQPNQDRRDDEQGPAISRVRKRKMQENKRLFACPVAKHCQVYDLRASCKFKGKHNMSEVKLHLQTRIHHDVVPFIVLCRHCWAYVINHNDYNNNHKENRCRNDSQRRGTRATENWESLYRTIYPNSNRVPSPWNDERGWRHIGPFVERGEAPSTEYPGPIPDATFDQSFLDQQSIGHGNPPPLPNLEGAFHDPVLYPAPFHDPAPEQPVVPDQVPDLWTQQAQQLAENAATDLFVSMFRDQFRRPGDLNDYHMDQLMRHAGEIGTEPVQQFSNRFLERAYSIYQNLQSQADANSPRLALPDTQTSHDDRLVYNAQVPPWPPLQASQLNNSWLGHFPVPDHMRQIPQNLYLFPSAGMSYQDHFDFPSGVMPYQNLSEFPLKDIQNSNLFIPLQYRAPEVQFETSLVGPRMNEYPQGTLSSLSATLSVGS